MWFNQIKTAILLGSLSGLLLLIGGYLGGTQGITTALIMALIMNLIAYFFSDKIVLSMYGAKPLDEHQYGWIYSIMRELTGQANLPMPKLWLIPTNMANAFATGRNPKHSSVAVTTGILDILDKNELRGVLAHEISHIKNRDILVSTVAATIATAIGYIANMLQWMSFTSNNDDRRRSGNPVALILLAILLPIAATLIQLAISRSREYLADESGAEISHDPLALASALQKLNANIVHDHLAKDNATQATTAHLFIVNPFTSESFATLFATHPPMSKRIEKLHRIYENMKTR